MQINFPLTNKQIHIYGYFALSKILPQHFHNIYILYKYIVYIQQRIYDCSLSYLQSAPA